MVSPICPVYILFALSTTKDTTFYKYYRTRVIKVEFNSVDTEIRSARCLEKTGEGRVEHFGTDFCRVFIS